MAITTITPTSASARHGLRWYEFDLNWYTILIFAGSWDLRPISADAPAHGRMKAVDLTWKGDRVTVIPSVLHPDMARVSAFILATGIFCLIKPYLSCDRQIVIRACRRNLGALNS